MPKISRVAFITDGLIIIVLNLAKTVYYKGQTGVNKMPHHTLNSISHMRGFSKFCQRRPNFDNVLFIFIFLVDEGKEDPNTTISGRADDGPSLNAGLVAL